MWRSRGRCFPACGRGQVDDMERSELLKEMQDAETPDQTSTAIYDARAWLAAHPDDEEVISAVENLIQAERRTLGIAY